MSYKHIFWIALMVLGSILAIFPNFTGEKAYFAEDDFYINIKDSVDLTYGPFVVGQVQQKLNASANQEKKAFRDSLKSYADSLEVVSLELKNKRGKSAQLQLEKVKILRDGLNRKIRNRESDIDLKYDVSSISEGKRAALASQTAAEIPLEDFIVLVANDLKNPAKSAKITPWTKDDISIQTVKQQPMGPFLLVGFIMIVGGVFLLLYEEGKISLASKGQTYVYSVIFGVFAIIAAGLIYDALGSKINFETKFEERQTAVIDKLELIRKAQLSYFEAKGKYASDWNDLSNFLKNDTITVIKQLVNPDDSVAVQKATEQGLAISTEEKIAAYTKAFGEQSVDVSKLSLIPFSDEEFEINAGRIERNGRDVFVFEVSAVKYDFVKNLSNCPENFDKSSALVLGSMREPTTEGNW